MLGLLAWLAQLGVFHLMGENSHIAYGLATAAVYPLLVLINFFIQRQLIFDKEGCFKRFFTINFLVMLLMVVIAPWFRWMITLWLGATWGDTLGFAAAAIIVAPISFFAMRRWVFCVSEKDISFHKVS